MSDDVWSSLVEDFVERRIGVNAFHDRFFDLWHARFDEGSFPEPIERLFFTVEAYTPDPALRSPGSPFEASEDEVRRDAEIALARLKADRR